MGGNAPCEHAVSIRGIESTCAILTTKLSSSMDGEISESDFAEGKAVATDAKMTDTYEITLGPLR